ncbi:hypothetical protein SA58113_1655 [Staphylococcus argenteus]|nr:hypothetical protein SA58113_1655 [Staphylococcus argenteus]
MTILNNKVIGSSQKKSFVLFRFLAYKNGGNNKPNYGNNI